MSTAPPYDAGYPPPTQQGYPPQQEGYPPPQQPYPPQQQPYPPQQPAPAPQQQSNTTVVVQQPAAGVVGQFGSTPQALPDGNVTVLRYKSGMLTWILVAVICFFTLECGICCVGLIPLCISACKDVEHIHPVTGQVVGVYRRL